MASRVVYIQRSDRGSRLTGVRLVSPRTDEQWLPKASDDAGAEDATDTAADWITARAGNSKRIAMMILDAEGGICSWANIPSVDSAVVDAIVRQQLEAGEDRGPEQAEGAPTESGAGPARFYAPSASDSTVQPLWSSPLDAGQDDESRRRASVLAISDGIARVLLDSIDARGVECNAVHSIWHGIAGAWDPSAAVGPANADNIVAESQGAPVGIIVIEPGGRLLWAWARGGRLLVGGLARLPVRRNAATDQTEIEVPLLTRDIAARVTADWLAWTAQLACAPDRIVMIIPTGAEDAADDSLGAAGFGRAIARSWSGAPVDVAIHDDPIGATLHRLAEVSEERDETPSLRQAPDPGRQLVTLTNRPGGAHRKLYLWSSLAITAGAVVVGILAWGLRIQASRVSALSRQVESSWKDPFKEVKLTRPPMPGMEAMDLQSEVERVRRESMPISGVEQARPIVREFEILSHVLALPDFELNSISLDTRAGTVSIQVNAPDLASGEALSDALGRIAGSQVTSWSFVPGARVQGSEKVPCSYTGAFPATPAKPPTGGQS
ncbi:MAG: hypothetical protein IT435_06550 [Phycisphaerales bacterium]|nr:hypothetical protein [Phycisphaerales bacterium]